MSYEYDSRYHHRPRHDSHYTSRETDPYGYARSDKTLAEAREQLADMRQSNPYTSSYTPSYNTYTYEPRTSPPLPPRRPAPHSYRSHRQEQTWPPSPSVEDEREALAKEAPSSVGSSGQAEGEPPSNTRGTVDQDSLLDEIEQPSVAQHDRRYVLVSESSTDDDGSTLRDRRRRSFADRGGMSHINTDVPDPPVFTERVRAPYGYSKPQKESTAPSPADYMRSPEPITPSNSSHPRPDASRPSRPMPTESRHNSYTSPASKKEYVFDSDSDSEAHSTTHLRTERKPARYSFVKSDLQREDLRTNLRDTQERPEPRRHDSGQRPLPTIRKGDSSGSYKEYPNAESPRSSSSSVHSTRRSRPVPVDTVYANSSRPLSRPSSPSYRAPSPQLPTRLRDSPPGSRPSSRGGPRPTSPLASSFQPSSPGRGRGPVSESDWHSTYPPAPSDDRSRQPSRYGRHDTMPLPRPRIDVHSPSPARQSTGDSLPYPIDDQLIDVFMPPEEHYQFDHSTVCSPRQSYVDIPRATSPAIPSSPYTRDLPSRARRQDTETLEEPSRPRRSRSGSFRSHDGRRDRSSRRTASMDRKLPDCPRPYKSGPYDDWYALQDNKNFNICPSCYEGVFAGTPFDVDFKQVWLNDYSLERSCDFSSPWARLAWLLTLQRGRKSLDLINAIAGVMDTVAKPCPGDREAGAEDRISWYGITNPRDGTRVANFAICSSDRRMLEALLPSLRGCFAKMPKDDRHVCSLRTSSTRFPKYLDLLVELDVEAELSGQLPDLSRFVLLLRENSYKGECQRYKILFRKPWHFIPSLPEFTVCEQCYDELIWPATQSRSTSSSIPHMFNKSIQLVPGEDPDVGSSCCLWSPRMRDVWKEAVRYDDFSYLKDTAKERKRAESKYMKNRVRIMTWMGDAEKGTRKWKEAEDAMRELKKTPQKEEMPTPGERQKTVAQPVLTRDQYRIRKLTKENARLRWEVKERDSRISSLVECQDALKEDLAAEKKNAKAYRERLMFEKRDVDDLEAELRTARRKLNSLRVSLLDTDDERNWSDWEVDEQNEE
ncbi:hypothetical protein J4E85_006850 [Alternaria conjuncta]|uniref:uncharacterized protein n=1 Tax=Alternaria conjuncta TaxID=181017 RepID=UPI00221F8747|nr:uncharacterized protein J4E85_006850 [Alternaria conjuncta]KAI4926556.1 hypothetical protein J4E85_006850 [Alternaria conjuncta]